MKVKREGQVVVGQFSFGQWECSHVGLCGPCGDPKWGGTMSNLEDVILKYVEAEVFVLVWGNIVVKWERRGGSGGSEKRPKEARVMMRDVVALKPSAVG